MPEQLAGRDGVLSDGSSAIVYWVRGWIEDVTPFLDAAWRALTDFAAPDEKAPVGTVFVVSCTHYAKLQTGFSREEGFAHELRDYDGPGRGRFQATAFCFPGAVAWLPTKAKGAPFTRRVTVLRP